MTKPLIQYYYTQFVGDPISLPILKAAVSFKGMAVIDADPYDDKGDNWYTNQNNFFRQIRNFVIDLTAMPPSKGTGIHWQVAQATSLQNLRFEMVKGGVENKQQGVFMENGSGGFMTDLIFNGGYYGAFLGSQQFTTRNLTFNYVHTAIFMDWNWLWAFKSLSINDCKVGINMSNGGNAQTVGSVLVQDSKFERTPLGIVTAYKAGSSVSNGTLVIDNVDFTGCSKALVDPQGKVLLPGSVKVASFTQGHGSKAMSGPKPASLLNTLGAVAERSKPQYETVPASSFISVKSYGAKGDGATDDTEAIQKIFNCTKPGQVIYFDHGVYIVSKTVRVPPNIKITGEVWPLIMASGAAFRDQTKPSPVFQVGQPGEVGCVEMSDLIFLTQGPQPGAILIEWNLAEPFSSQAKSGMWDIHFRIGGAAGTKLQSDNCARTPNVTTVADPNCEAAFLLLHITKSARSVYIENSWYWVADHDLDRKDHGQINIYNGRGVLVESQGPVWLYGTSSEHHQLYNYQLSEAKDVYMSVIQTETPSVSLAPYFQMLTPRRYMQSNPSALTPFLPHPSFPDPTFSSCGSSSTCAKAWGLRVLSSSSIHIYGAGLYSFFDNYNPLCLKTESCQENIVSIEGCGRDVYLWGLSTKASANMVTLDGRGVISQQNNRNNFCSTIAVFAS